MNHHAHAHAHAKCVMRLSYVIRMYRSVTEAMHVFNLLKIQYLSLQHSRGGYEMEEISHERKWNMKCIDYSVQIYQQSLHKQYISFSAGITNTSLEYLNRTSIAVLDMSFTKITRIDLIVNNTQQLEELHISGIKKNIHDNKRALLML